MELAPLMELGISTVVKAFKEVIDT